MTTTENFNLAVPFLAELFSKDYEPSGSRDPRIAKRMVTLDCIEFIQNFVSDDAKPDDMTDFELSKMLNERFPHTYVDLEDDSLEQLEEIISFCVDDMAEKIIDMMDEARIEDESGSLAIALKMLKDYVNNMHRLQ